MVHGGGQSGLGGTQEGVGGGQRGYASSDWTVAWSVRNAQLNSAVVVAGSKAVAVGLVCVCVCMYAYIYVCVCVCVCVCLYTYVHTCYVLTNPPIPSSRCKYFVVLRPV
jgi:hypothetical protein